MKQFSLIPHTADIRLQASGTTYSELFQAALEGMASLMSREIKGPPFTIAKEIELTAPDVTVLLIDFLSRVLTISQIERAVFPVVTVVMLTEKTLRARISGEQIKRFAKDIKAVTYHEAQVTQGSCGLYAVTIVFDI